MGYVHVHVHGHMHGHVHVHAHVHVHVHMHVHVLDNRGELQRRWLRESILAPRPRPQLSPTPPSPPHLRPRQVNATPAALVGASAAAARLVTSDGGVLEAGRPLHWCACHRWGWGLGYGWGRGLD